MAFLNSATVQMSLSPHDRHAANVLAVRGKLVNEIPDHIYDSVGGREEDLYDEPRGERWPSGTSRPAYKSTALLGPAVILVIMTLHHVTPQPFPLEKQFFCQRFRKFIAQHLPSHQLLHQGPMTKVIV